MSKLSSKTATSIFRPIACLGYDAPLAHNDSGFHYTMQNKLFITPRLVAFLLIAWLLQACSFPGVFKINVQQGNIVTQDMLDKLKPGMTKKQVHFVLGNPVLKNSFDASIDTFVYTYQEAGGEIKQQTVTVYYDKDLYSRYDAELLDDHPAY